MRIRTKLIRIGNSRGIRLPKPVIEHAGIEDEVDLTMEDGRVVIEAADQPRAGWDKQFREESEFGHDELLLPKATNEWDGQEWEWASE